MTPVQVEFDHATGIGTITINRPAVLNAIDVPTARGIGAAVQTLASESRLRCTVLRGAGRAFIAGGDLATFARDFDAAGAVVDELLEALNPAILTLRSQDAPVIASVHGVVAGAGLSLMGACDLVVAAEGTRFLSAYERIGASPDCGGTWFIPRLIGARRAMQLVFLSETWTTELALQFGLINCVVPAVELAQHTDAWATQIASGPTLAYGAYKRLVHQAFNQSLNQQLEFERAAFKFATHTVDFRTGVSAFLSGESALFKGQ